MTFLGGFCIFSTTLVVTLVITCSSLTEHLCNEITFDSVHSMRFATLSRLLKHRPQSKATTIRRLYFRPVVLLFSALTVRGAECLCGSYSGILTIDLTLLFRGTCAVISASSCSPRMSSTFSSWIFSSHVSNLFSFF